MFVCLISWGLLSAYNIGFQWVCKMEGAVLYLFPFRGSFSGKKKLTTRIIVDNKKAGGNTGHTAPALMSLDRNLWYSRKSSV